MDDVAAKHYLVERIESDLLTRNRMNVWRATRSGFGRGTPLVAPALPDPSRPLVMSEADADEIRRNAQGDMVRVLDREGNVVWWREYRSRESSIKKHAEIMDDLMKLASAAFRRKYGIIPERPLEVDAARATAASGGPAPGSADDPSGPWAERIRRSEGGADQQAPGEIPGGSREGDVGWGDFGRR